MGKQKHLKKIEALFNKSDVVNFASIKKIVGDENYSKLLVHNLVKKGRIHKLAKGYYTKKDNPELLVFCLKPAYLGLQDALSFHDLWEQETIPIIITTRKVRVGIREVFGSNVLVFRIDKKYFYGFDYIKKEEKYLPYSDVEKTFIDLSYFSQVLNNETMQEIKKRLNRKKLKEYLVPYPENIKKRILKLIY